VGVATFSRNGIPRPAGTYAVWWGVSYNERNKNL